MQPSDVYSLSHADVERAASHCGATCHALLDFAGAGSAQAMATLLARDLLLDVLHPGSSRARALADHVLKLTGAARKAGVDINEVLVRLSRFVAQVEHAVPRPRELRDERAWRRAWLDVDMLVNRIAMFAYFSDSFPSEAALDGAIRRLIVERSRVRDVVRAASEAMDRGSDAVIATDIAGTILYWNKLATALYGWRDDEVLGRNIIDVTPAQHTAEEAQGIMRQLAQGETWSGRFAVRDRHGVAMLVDVTDVPVHDGGAIVGVVGISTPTITP